MQYISKLLPTVPLYLYNTLLSLLHHCCQLWLTADQYEEMKKAEEDSLYRYKSKVHIIDLSSDGANGDSSKENELLQTLFPQFDHEFTVDSDGTTTDTTTEQQAATNDKVEEDQHNLSQFTDEEMDRIVRLQSYLFTPDCHKCPIDHLYIMNMYRTAQDILTSLNNGHNLSAVHTLAGVIQACSGVNSLLTCSIPSTNKYVDCRPVFIRDCVIFRQFNIYRDSCVAEAKKAWPVIQELVHRIQEVLVELPDYPVLKQVYHCTLTLFFSYIIL